ncbi:hypothetical protein F2Q68_00023747 [Brassica cretica]|uniref:Uncharacterized protein n=1 Tax=Brassica cretica TaxID=69181 RepID=A0A8S9I9P9_BRACR|nr:hypothetical protein F2Q68_00023747 [Brassica cretica]
MTIITEMPLKGLQTSQTLRAVLRVKLEQRAVYSVFVFKKFKPTIRSKRCFLLFPVQGSERKGLVSVEVKKKKGQVLAITIFSLGLDYDMKLLAVDIPMASGPDQRLYLIGDEEGYKVGGGLISELRDPVVKAMAATKEFDNLDRIEEEEDAERELQEAERKHREEIEKLEKESS